MDYSVFTKEELIEAINDSKYGYLLKGYLLRIWNRKMSDSIAKTKKLSQKLVEAMKNGDVEQYLKIQEEMTQNEFEYNKLRQAIN